LIDFLTRSGPGFASARAGLDQPPPERPSRNRLTRLRSLDYTENSFSAGLKTAGDLGKVVKIEPIEAVCPKCGRTKIFFLNREPVPKCEVCGLEMLIKEMLVEGKHD